MHSLVGEVLSHGAALVGVVPRASCWSAGVVGWGTHGDFLPHFSPTRDVPEPARTGRLQREKPQAALAHPRFVISRAAAVRRCASGGRLHVQQHVGQVVLGVEAVGLAGGHQGVEAGEALSLRGPCRRSGWRGDRGARGLKMGCKRELHCYILLRRDSTR